MASIKLQTVKNSALTGATSHNWIGSVRINPLLSWVTCVFFVAYSAYFSFSSTPSLSSSFSYSGRHPAKQLYTHTFGDTVYEQSTCERT